MVWRATQRWRWRTISRRWRRSSGTSTIYYRSGTSAWTAVTIGTGLTFTSGTLDRAALTGDVTAASGGNATTIANGAVTYAKMQNVSAASLLLGRGSAAGAGAPQEITLGTNLTMSGTTLNAGGGGGSITVNVQKFTASGTYTPTSGMRYCTIEVVGGGGGGGGCASPSSQTQGAGGGGSGGYSRVTVAAAAIGASKTVTIGAAGTAGTAAGGTGGSGGQTSVSTLCVANGGAGGIGGNNTATTSLGGGLGGDLTGVVGDLTAAGNPGDAGNFRGDLSSTHSGGNGGASFFGGGGRGAPWTSSSTVGGAASNYGAGGGGAQSANAATNRAGGAGSAGFVIITEYL